MYKQISNTLFTKALLFLLLLAFLSFSVQAKTHYTGVNLAGAEFGTGASGFENLPGVYGTHYTYPTHEEIDYFTGKGMNIFRLPFRWERLQVDINGSFDAIELARINDFVSYASSKQAKIILDPHNSARYYDATQIIGVDGSGGAVPVAAFQNFWTKLAFEFKDNDHVIFGLINEPHDMSSELWRDDANAAIVAIRATGATNLILVPGNAWSGAHSWNDNWYGTPNGTVMQDIVDSGNNYAFEVHQYLDSDSSGTSATCVSSTIGSARLQDFTNWLHQHNKRGFLGEFAGGRNANCYSALNDMLDFVDANDDVWLGWTYWAAGPWWGEDIYTLEPETDGTDRPQMAVLLEHMGGTPSVTTLVSPSGNIIDNTPAYVWNAVSGATWYYLWVNDSSGNKIKQWYTAEAVGCASGLGTCTTTSTISLANGSGQWWVQTWNASGYGPWSIAYSFNLNSSGVGVPAATTLVSPSGNIIDNTPAYVWNAVSGATWYYLWVNDSSGNKIKQWYTAEAVGCASGLGTCTTTSTILLANGAGQWWVQTWNASGYGPWSIANSFNLSSSGTGVPTAATLLNPEGSIDENTTTFSWEAVSGSTWYYLWVNDSTGNIIKQWYTASQTGCASGTGECYISPATVLANGSARWWVQTWNTFGSGPWSNALNFTVN